MRDEDKIQKRAYEIWEQEGRPDGRHEAHWQMASDETDGQDGDDAPTGLSTPLHPGGTLPGGSLAVGEGSLGTGGGSTGGRSTGTKASRS